MDMLRNSLESESISSPRNIEIRHIAEYDLIINRQCVTQPELDIILSELTSKPIETWPKGNYNRSKLINFEETPLFFVKKRIRKEGMYLAEVINSQSSAERMRHAARATVAIESLLNEISISNQVSKISSSPEAQSYAQTAGFKKIMFVEPLVGIIHKTVYIDPHVPRIRKKVYDKYMVYRYVDAQSIVFQYHELGINREMLYELIEKLKKMYTLNGIVPFDLVLRQLLLANNNLYLIDTEGYYRP
jgi:hypothetical protein